MEQEVRRRLEQEDSWHKAAASANLLTAASAKEFKSIVLSAAPSTLVVADFFSPSCHACRSMWPKLKQVAANSPDVTFVKIDTAQAEGAALADGLGVSKLPWFVFFEGGSGEQVASFTANLATINTLRAEIAGRAPCTDEHCRDH